MTTDPGSLSSLEMQLLGLAQQEKTLAKEPLHKGAACPHCGQGVLDYNGLLQLACPACGYADSENGGCT